MRTKWMKSFPHTWLNKIVENELPPERNEIRKRNHTNVMQQQPHYPPHSGPGTHPQVMRLNVHSHVPSPLMAPVPACTPVAGPSSIWTPPESPQLTSQWYKLGNHVAANQYSTSGTLEHEHNMTYSGNPSTSSFDSAPNHSSGNTIVTSGMNPNMNVNVNHHWDPSEACQLQLPPPVSALQHFLHDTGFLWYT